MRVLVVEDERNLADAIARGLRRKGMAVDVAYDGSTGHEMAYVTRYDVVVLDRDLPGMHGDEICAARTTTCRSRSPSTSWSPGCRRWAGAPRLRRRRC